VETLQASFEKIDTKARNLVRRGRTDRELGTCLRDAWSSQFHTLLSDTAVRGLISHYRAVEPAGKRKTRKQRGGMAPLDYTMGQGISDFTYGRFPVEMGAQPSVVKSLDRFYESPIGRSCDSTGGYTAPGQAAQAAQAGGGFLDSFLMPHAPTSVPQNFAQYGLTAIQGAPDLRPHPSPVTAHPPLASVSFRPFDPQAITQISKLTSVYQPPQ
jgi:hypothetical protein